jgi:hypothetical protein
MAWRDRRTDVRYMEWRHALKARSGDVVRRHCLELWARELGGTDAPMFGTWNGDMARRQGLERHGIACRIRLEGQTHRCSTPA